MLFNSVTVGRVGARTRLLAYGLFGYCSAMVFLGPSVAELGLGALGCPGSSGSAQSGCQGLAILPASALVPWLNVAPPVETVFLLLQQSWALIAGWFVLIALSARSDRRRGPSGAAQPDAPQVSELRSTTSTGNASLAERSRGLLSLHPRVRAQGALWGSLPSAIVLLLVALAVFCLLLGTPLLGGLSADSILQTLRCTDQALMGSNPWSGFCGFWVDRLEPYQRPWYGALLSPFWLFTQFSDVLLIWMALILVLVLMFSYRLGWGALFKKTPLFVKTGGLVLFGAALFGQFFGLSRVVPPPVHSDGGLGSIAGTLPILFTVGAGLVLGLVAGLIALIAFAIYLVRHFKRARDQTAPEKKMR